MITDIRLDISFPTHKKTMKLCRRLADQSAPWMLVKLWIYVAQHMPDGILSGMDVEDMELVAGWMGEPGLFISTLLDVGYLDKRADGSLECHDWLTHNPWVAESGDRSESSRFSKLAQVAPDIHMELKRKGVKSVGKNDYALIKRAATTGKSLTDIIGDLAIFCERTANASDSLANDNEPLANDNEPLAPAPSPVPVPLPDPSLKPKDSLAAASSQASTTPTPSPPVGQQQQPGKVVTIFADSENQIRTAFRERHDFLALHFPYLNLAVEEEQCVLKYRNKPITCEAGLVVFEWCKRCPKPEARSRDRPSRQEESVQRGLDNLAVAMEAIYAAEGV